MPSMPPLQSAEVQPFLRALDRPEAAQQAVLQRIVSQNASSAFGTRCGFASVSTMADFRRCTPVAGYAAFAPAIDKMVLGGEQGLLTSEPVKRFFLTSGSSAKSKYIPVTRSLLQAKSRAFSTFWSSVFEAHPAVKRAGMVTNFSDGGEAVSTPGGLPSSSESAYWSSVSRAAALGRAPMLPACVASIGDSEARYYALARLLLEQPVSGIMSLNPSTIVLLFEKIAAHASALADDLERGTIGAGVRVPDEVVTAVADRCAPNPRRAAALRALIDENAVLAHRLWPTLALGVCWRSPMLRPYMELLQPHFGPCAQRDFITMASEGVMSLPIDPRRRGGPLAIDSHVYEFIRHTDVDETSPETLLPHELTVGERYVVVMTTQGGLYRYNIGDVVEVTGFAGRTPCIEFQHRAGSTCSLTGEKLTEDQVTEAMAEAMASLPVEAFTIAPAPEGFPRYIALLEFKDALAAGVLEGLPHRLDEALEQQNIEYGSKRSSQRLGAPEVWVVQRGSFERFRRQRLASGTSDSQFKPTHLTRDVNFSEQFDIEERVRAR
ncbi:MAG: GH3 auxin-responsive promoter family protein [Myxococcota bacterium]